MADSDPEVDTQEQSAKKRRKRPGAKRTSKMKREAKAKGKAAFDANQAGERPTREGAGGLGEAEHAPKKKKLVKEILADKELENRVWVGGLAENTDEQLLLDHFGVCGTISNVTLIRNSRLIFRGAAFISFKKAAGLQAALDMDGTALNEQVLKVRKAAAPVQAPDLKVYIAGLPWKATEEILQKDFGECGEIAKLHMLKDMNNGKFKGVMFVTYKTQAGVDAALKYHETDYGGHLLVVRLSSAGKPPPNEKSKRPREDAAVVDEEAAANAEANAQNSDAIGKHQERLQRAARKKAKRNSGDA